jgi:5-methylcytosine-specific restriction endonuclease McrA
MHAVKPSATVVSLPARGARQHAAQVGGQVVARARPGGSSVPHASGGAGGTQVLVLNATYEPIHVCGVKRAVVLLLKEKAEVVEAGGGELHAERTSLPRPAIIRLRTYAPVPRRNRRRLTRRAVFARDEWACQYCGSGSDLTVDHVIPRSKGGSSEWENVVACCASCNRRKADRLPHQARMFPKCTPRAPHPSIFIQIACVRVPESWDPWLANAA